MNAKSGTVIFIVILAVIIGKVIRVLLAGQGTRPGSPGVLPGVEVREYQGEDLSSINDFRENSIKGPQHIQYIRVPSYREWLDQ